MNQNSLFDDVLCAEKRGATKENFDLASIAKLQFAKLNLLHEVIW